MNFTLDVNIRFPDLGAVSAEPKLLSAFQSLKDQVMTTLEDIKTTEVAETAAAVDALISVIKAQSAVIVSVQLQLDAAIAASATDPLAFDALKASLDEIQARAAAAVADAGGVPVPVGG